MSCDSKPCALSRRGASARCEAEQLRGYHAGAIDYVIKPLISHSGGEGATLDRARRAIALGVDARYRLH